MKLNNFGYLLKEGFKGIFLHGFMSFAAICVTVACLLIVGSFSILAYNLDVMVEELNQTSEILVYVDDALTDAEAKSIGTKINMLDNVLQSTFISREEALADFKADHDGDSAFDGVQAEDLRHRFVVTLESNALMEQTDKQLNDIPGVAKTNAAYELAEGFTTIQSVLHMVTYAMIAVLLVVSLLIISNTVKLAMYDRKDEIAIMKMVGATNGFIRWPFVVEGFILGVTASLLAFFLQWGLYDFLQKQILKMDTLQLFTMIPFREVIELVAVAYAIVGFLVGVVGSMLSIRKFLNV